MIRFVHVQIALIAAAANACTLVVENELAKRGGGVPRDGACDNEDVPFQTGISVAPTARYDGGVLWAAFHPAPMTVNAAQRPEFAAYAFGTDAGVFVGLAQQEGDNGVLAATRIGFAPVPLVALGAAHYDGTGTPAVQVLLPDQGSPPTWRLRDSHGSAYADGGTSPPLGPARNVALTWIDFNGGTVAILLDGKVVTCYPENAVASGCSGATAATLESSLGPPALDAIVPAAGGPTWVLAHKTTTRDEVISFPDGLSGTPKNVAGWFGPMSPAADIVVAARLNGGHVEVAKVDKNGTATSNADPDIIDPAAGNVSVAGVPRRGDIRRADHAFALARPRARRAPPAPGAGVRAVITSDRESTAPRARRRRALSFFPRAPSR